MSGPFKLNKSPLELWPFGKKAKMKRKLKRSVKDKKTSQTKDSLKKYEGMSDAELEARRNE